jgi:hypothetical protein
MNPGCSSSVRSLDDLERAAGTASISKIRAEPAPKCKGRDRAQTDSERLIEPLR